MCMSVYQAITSELNNWVQRSIHQNLSTEREDQIIGDSTSENETETASTESEPSIESQEMPDTEYASSSEDEYDALKNLTAEKRKL